MVDLGPVLKLIGANRLQLQPRPQVGTGWEQSRRLNSKDVPTVPAVPTGNGKMRVPSATDVLERSAYLEFCEGLGRKAADSLALAERGFPSWESLDSAVMPSGSDTHFIGEARDGK